MRLYSHLIAKTSFLKQCMWGVSICFWCWPYYGVWPFMLRQSLVWVQTTEFKYKSVGSTLTCNDVNDDSCRVIRNGVPLFRHQRSNNIRTDNLHKNVKLECVREKYWHREEQKCNLGRAEKKRVKIGLQLIQPAGILSDSYWYLYMRHRFLYIYIFLFLAVQNSSIGDLVTKGTPHLEKNVFFRATCTSFSAVIKEYIKCIF